MEDGDAEEHRKRKEGREVDGWKEDPMREESVWYLWRIRKKGPRSTAMQMRKRCSRAF